MIRSRIGWRRVGFLAGDRDAEKPKDNTPASLASLALPGLAWVQIESAAVEVEGRLEILDIAEAAGYALNLLNLAVESFAHRVGHRMLVGGRMLSMCRRTVSAALRIGASRRCVAQKYHSFLNFQPDTG